MVYQAVRKPIGNGAARVQRKFSILTRLYDERKIAPTGKYAGDPDWRGWLTTWEIAKAVGLTPSNHLRGILIELCAEGFIEQSVKPWRSNVTSAMWRIAPGARDSSTWAGAFNAYLGGLESA